MKRIIYGVILLLLVLQGCTKYSEIKVNVTDTPIEVNVENVPCNDCFCLPEDEQEPCYQTKEWRIKDISYCDNPNEPEWMYSCYQCLAWKQNSSEICDMIPGNISSYKSESHRSICFKILAELTGNVTLCESTSAGFFPGSGRDACLSGVAQTTLNKSLCEKIELEYTADLCRTEITKQIEINLKNFNDTGLKLTHPFDMCQQRYGKV